MITDTDIDRATLTLAAAGLRAPDAWADSQVRELGLALWRAALEGLDGRQLDEAVLRHLGHPERGRWWPTPADLLSAAGSSFRGNAHDLIADSNEMAWLAITGKATRILQLRGGPRPPGLELHLSTVEQRALDSVGGIYAVATAEGGAAIGSLRKRFLAACVAGESAKVLRLPVREDRPALPPTVAAFLGTGAEDPDREARRQRIRAERGGDR